MKTEGIKKRRFVGLTEFKESHTNLKTSVDSKNLTIEIPLSTLVNAFKYYPNNPEGAAVKRGGKWDFAELVAEHLHDEIDQETGASHITSMLDGLFESLIDGYVDTGDIIKFPEYD